MKRSFADILQDLDGDRARKLARKLPEWAAADAEIPSALSLEQCSSSATALYKASVALMAASGETAAATAPENCATLGIIRGGTASVAQRWGPAEQDVFRGSWPLRGVEAAFETVLDLTGGLGVDSWGISKVAERVVYFERDAELAAAAERNFARLGAGNIEVRCETVTPETDLPEADLIYADPARRDAAGRKVFLLEDCTPDILTLLPGLLQKAPTVLLKLSPMADLAMLADRLGPALQEIHVVELDGEVKELLCLLRREPALTEPVIVIALLRKGDSGSSAGMTMDKAGGAVDKAGGAVDKAGGAIPFYRHSGLDPESLRFTLSEERAAAVQYAGEVRPGDTLLEPCPALLKAGAFRLPCSRWGLLKLASSTHLYLLPDLPGAEKASSAPGDPFFPSPGANPAADAPGLRFFKARAVREVLPLSAASFKDLRKRFPRAEITARNLPLGSDALRKKLGVAPGGDVHIFGCRLADGSAVLIVTNDQIKDDIR